jgi:hypothetical protein
MEKIARERVSLLRKNSLELCGLPARFGAAANYIRRENSCIYLTTLIFQLEFYSYNDDDAICTPQDRLDDPQDPKGRAFRESRRACRDRRATRRPRVRAQGRRGPHQGHVLGVSDVNADGIMLAAGCSHDQPLLTLSMQSLPY